MLRRSHAAAFRGALWITLIAIVTTGLALTVQYVQTTRLMAARVQALLEDEIMSLADRYEAGGVVELADVLQRYQQRPRVDDEFYVLAHADGTVIVGDLSAWPPGVQEPGAHRFRITIVTGSEALQQRWAETRTVLLDGRYRLLVGRLSADRAEVRKQYVSAMLWSFLITALMGLLLGWWFSRRGLAFLEKVSEAGARFLHGHLEERIPVSERGDEYDRLAETMNACFDEIEHVVRSLRAATDGMAHDLKTPLTRIRARLELAEMRNAGEAELREAVEASGRDLDALLRVIDGVLTLARAEATTAENFTEFDLCHLVQEVLDLYEPVAEARGIAFEAGLEAAPVRGARPLLGQLVANLIDNAVKYSPDGQPVSVIVGHDGTATQLRVSDRGPGIPANRREDVLSRFVRLDESRGKEGGGIGLSIVSAVARVHGASLKLSDNDPGLRATVTFPAPRLPGKSAE